jgi:hypothetical protein
MRFNKKEKIVYYLLCLIAGPTKKNIKRF